MADTTDFDLEKVRDNTQKELERKIAERKQLDREISGLRVALNGFDATIHAQRNKYELDPIPLSAEFEGIRKMGLTDAVRKVLESAPGGMTPKDVRDKLMSLQYKLPKGNALAAIHGVYTRLEKMREIEPTQPDKKAYRWIPPIERWRFSALAAELNQPHGPNPALAGLGTDDDNAVKAFLDGKRSALEKLGKKK